MKRAFVSLLMAALFGAVLAGPAAAKASISVSFCTNTGSFAGWGTVYIPWTNGSGVTTEDLHMTISFKGKKIADALPDHDFPAGIPQTGFTREIFPAFADAPDWNVFTTVTVKTTGAFRAAATVRQPAGGWPVCV